MLLPTKKPLRPSGVAAFLWVVLALAALVPSRRNAPTGTGVKVIDCLIPEQSAVPLQPILRRTLGVSP